VTDGSPKVGARWSMRFLAVKPEERAAVGWAAALFFFALGSYMVLRPVRDAMGIASGVDDLTWLFTGTFVVMLIAVPLLSAVAARVKRGRLVPVVHHLFALSLVAFFIALGHAEANVRVVAARALYVWISVLNLFVVSVFWALMADLWGHGRGRRVFGAIAVGGSAGAIVGPAATAALTTRIGVPALLLISAGLLEIGLVCLRMLLRNRPPAVEGGPLDDDTPVGGRALDGIRHLLRSRYLAGIGGWTLLLSFTGTILYFEQARLVHAAVEGDAARTVLFARMDLVVNVAALVLQGFVAHRLIARFGLGPTLAILPLVTAVGLVVLGLHFELWTLVILEIVRRGASFGVAGPSREVLFTVVSRRDKYLTKPLLDTVVLRGGDVTSGWLFAALVSLGMGLPGIALLAAPAAAAWMALSWRLGRSAEARAPIRASERFDGRDRTVRR
jgi:ATP:ADP antiporter, AAA family